MSSDHTRGIYAIILTYNCAQFLENTIKLIPENTFERVIVMDDASTDGTMAEAERLGIEAYTHEHGGYGGNLKFGLKKAVELGAEFIVEIHGDGQFASSIPTAIEMHRSGHDMVLGNRWYNLLQPLRDKMSLIRYFGNMTLSGLGCIVLGLRQLDLFTGFRAYSKKLVETCDWTNTCDDYFFSFEIIVLARFANLKIGHVPARSFYDQDHTSISLWKGFLEIVQTPYALFQYLCARVGIRFGIFSRKHLTSGANGSAADHNQ